MTVQFPVAFPSFLFENQHFIALHVRKHLYYYFCTIDNWSSNFYISLVINEHHFLKLHLAAFLGVDPVDE